MTAIAVPGALAEAGAGRPARSLHDHTFELLHRNDILEVRPAQLHFSKFQIHQEHEQKLRILNISAKALRLTILGPGTQWFKIKFNKKGLLAPGMSEDIEVLFYPTDWHYYYDTISIYCAELGENLVVPLHAYPSAEIQLPHIIDFGTISIGTSRTKVIPLTCTIPVQFEFSITIVKSHPDFEVIPREGIIPAEGTTNVAITFLPSRHMTAHMELEFSMSAFDFHPVRISVVGSSHPDLSHVEVLTAGIQDVENEREKRKQQELLAKVTDLSQKQGRDPLKLKKPVIPVEEEIRVKDGIQIPLRNDQAATAFVLNQTPGKLPLKDLFAFIKEQREAAEQRRKKARTMTENDDEDDDRQARELRFEMGYREIEMFDKQKEIKSMVCLGEQLLTQDAIQAVKIARRDRFHKSLEATLKTDCLRTQSKLAKDPVCVPFEVLYPQDRPMWDEYSNAMFEMRLQVIDRFVRAGSKLLMRVRAARRLAKLHAALREAGVASRKQCKAWVDAESKATRTVGLNAGGDVPVVRLGHNFVLPASFPSTRPQMGEAPRDTIDMALVETFEQLLKCKPKERKDYEVLSYEGMPVPMAAYMRPNTGRRGELHACVEELSVRGPRGHVDDCAEPTSEAYAEAACLAMPQSCLLPSSHAPMSLIVPDSRCRTFLRPPDFTECHTEYRLGEVPPLREPSLDTLTDPRVASNQWQWLHIWRRTRTLEDPGCYFDPCCANTLLGGAGGPTLGHDVGGERFPFLPAEGFDHDVPSDTDSDGRDDTFALEPPDEATYMRDYFAGECPPELGKMDGPTVTRPIDQSLSERAAKAQWIDDQLLAYFRKNSGALRGRLEELNQHLPSELKSFLG